MSPSAYISRPALLALSCLAPLAACSETKGSQLEGKEERVAPPVAAIGDGDAARVVVASEGPPGDGDEACDGDGDGENAATPLELCTVEGALSVGEASGSLVIDDFDDGDSAILGNGLRGWWYSYDDGSDGFQTPDPWDPEPGGLTGGGFALHVTGGGYSEWGSVNGITLANGDDSECIFDGSAYDGISFWVRGSIELDPSKEDYLAEQDREVLKVQLIDKRVVPLDSGGTCDPFDGECWNAYRFRVPVDSCWTRYAVRFEELQQDEWGQKFGEIDPSQLTHFGVELGRYQTFDYWMDDIRFFIGETPETITDCSGTGLGGASGVEE